MFREIFKKIKHENGQAFMELALTLPVLILIIGGIVDLGWIFTNQSIIDHAAREGVRYAIVHSTDADAINVIKNYTKNLAPVNIRSSLTVSVVFSNSFNYRLGDVTVTVSGNVNVLTPITQVFTNGQVALDSFCTMKVE